MDLNSTPSVLVYTVISFMPVRTATAMRPESFSAAEYISGTSPEYSNGPANLLPPVHDVPFTVVLTAMLISLFSLSISCQNAADILAFLVFPDTVEGNLQSAPDGEAALGLSQ